MDLLSATAECLLGTPEAILARAWPTPRHRARQLLHRWHPDRNPEPRATAVFAHLQAAQRQWAVGRVSHPLCWATPDGAVSLRYLRRVPTAVGEAFYGAHVLLDTVHPDQADLIGPAQDLLAHWPFASPTMETQIRPLLPPTMRHVPTATDHLLVRDRPAGMIRLRELLAHVGGQLDPRHVAWIGSALWNLACYLHYAQVAHQALSLDSVWIHPADHRIAVLDPWLFAGRMGSPLRALPQATLTLAPRAYLAARTVDASIDHHLIRALLRELLGDRTGMNLSPTLPHPLAAFVRLPASGTAVAQYTTWKQTLAASFGKPTFVALTVSPTDIDPEN